MCKCSEILDEMIKEANKNHNNRHHTDTMGMYFDDCESNILSLAKSRIQVIGDGVPTITIPEGTVLIGKDEYEALKEKAWMYDDICNS